MRPFRLLTCGLPATPSFKRSLYGFEPVEMARLSGEDRRCWDWPGRGSFSPFCISLGGAHLFPQVSKRSHCFGVAPAVGGLWPGPLAFRRLKEFSYDRQVANVYFTASSIGGALREEH